MYLATYFSVLLLGRREKIVDVLDFDYNERSGDHRQCRFVRRVFINPSYDFSLHRSAIYQLSE